MTMTMTEPKGDAATIAKFFGLKGAEAVQAIRDLTTSDKAHLGEGIRNGSLTY